MPKVKSITQEAINKQDEMLATQTTASQDLKNIVKEQSLQKAQVVKGLAQFAVTAIDEQFKVTESFKESYDELKNIAGDLNDIKNSYIRQAKVAVGLNPDGKPIAEIISETVTRTGIEVGHVIGHAISVSNKIESVVISDEDKLFYADEISNQQETLRRLIEERENERDGVLTEIERSRLVGEERQKEIDRVMRQDEENNAVSLFNLVESIKDSILPFNTNISNKFGELINKFENLINMAGNELALQTEYLDLQSNYLKDIEINTRSPSKKDHSIYMLMETGFNNVISFLDVVPANDELYDLTDKKLSNIIELLKPPLSVNVMQKDNEEIEVRNNIGKSLRSELTGPNVIPFFMKKSLAENDEDYSGEIKIPELKRAFLGGIFKPKEKVLVGDSPDGSPTGVEEIVESTGTMKVTPLNKIKNIFKDKSSPIDKLEEKFGEKIKDNKFLEKVLPLVGQEASILGVSMMAKDFALSTKNLAQITEMITPLLTGLGPDLLLKEVGKNAGLLSSMSSVAPFISPALGILFAAMAIKDKDYMGAVLELASGTAGAFVPGIGAVLDIGIRGRRVLRDKKSKEMPQYEKGIEEVPEDGPAFLHKGETVLNKEDADKRREEGKNLGIEGGSWTIGTLLGGLSGAALGTASGSAVGLTNMLKALVTPAEDRDPISSIVTETALEGGAWAAGEKAVSVLGDVIKEKAIAEGLASNVLGGILGGGLPVLATNLLIQMFKGARDGEFFSGMSSEDKAELLTKMLGDTFGWTVSGATAGAVGTGVAAIAGGGLLSTVLAAAIPSLGAVALGIVAKHGLDKLHKLGISKKEIDPITSEAELPQYEKGGIVKETGPAIVHKDEFVLSKKHLKQLDSDMSKKPDFGELLFGELEDWHKGKFEEDTPTESKLLKFMHNWIDSEFTAGGRDSVNNEMLEKNFNLLTSLKEFYPRELIPNIKELFRGTKLTKKTTKIDDSFEIPSVSDETDLEKVVTFPIEYSPRSTVQSWSSNKKDVEEWGDFRDGKSIIEATIPSKNIVMNPDFMDSIGKTILNPSEQEVIAKIKEPVEAIATTDVYNLFEIIGKKIPSLGQPSFVEGPTIAQVGDAGPDGKGGEIVSEPSKLINIMGEAFEKVIGLSNIRREIVKEEPKKPGIMGRAFEELIGGGTAPKSKDEVDRIKEGEENTRSIVDSLKSIKSFLSPKKDKIKEIEEGDKEEEALKLAEEREEDTRNWREKLLDGVKDFSKKGFGKKEDPWWKKWLMPILAGLGVALAAWNLFSGGWEGFKDKLGSIADFFTSNNGALEGITKQLTKVGNALYDLPGKLSRDFDALSKSFSKGWSGMKESMSKGWETLKKPFTGMKDMLKGVLDKMPGKGLLSKAGEWIANKATAAKDAIVNKATAVKDAVVNKATAVKDAVVNKAAVLKDAVVNKAAVLKDAISSKIGKVGKGTGKVLSAGWKLLQGAAKAVTNPKVIQTAVKGLKAVGKWAVKKAGWVASAIMFVYEAIKIWRDPDMEPKAKRRALRKIAAENAGSIALGMLFGAIASAGFSSVAWMFGPFAPVAQIVASIVSSIASGMVGHASGSYIAEQIEKFFPEDAEDAPPEAAKKGKDEESWMDKLKNSALGKFAGRTLDRFGNLESVVGRGKTNYEEGGGVVDAVKGKAKTGMAAVSGYVTDKTRLSGEEETLAFKGKDNLAIVKKEAEERIKIAKEKKDAEIAILEKQMSETWNPIKIFGLKDQIGDIKEKFETDTSKDKEAVTDITDRTKLTNELKDKSFINVLGKTDIMGQIEAIDDNLTKYTGFKTSGEKDTQENRQEQYANEKDERVNKLEDEIATLREQEKSTGMLEFYDRGKIQDEIKSKMASAEAQKRVDVGFKGELSHKVDKNVAGMQTELDDKSWYEFYDKSKIKDKMQEEESKKSLPEDILKWKDQLKNKDWGWTDFGKEDELKEKISKGEQDLKGMNINAGESVDALGNIIGKLPEESDLATQAMGTLKSGISDVTNAITNSGIWKWGERAFGRVGDLESVAGGGTTNSQHVQDAASVATGTYDRTSRKAKELMTSAKSAVGYTDEPIKLTTDDRAREVVDNVYRDARTAGRDLKIAAEDKFGSAVDSSIGYVKSKLGTEEQQFNATSTNVNAITPSSKKEVSQMTTDERTKAGNAIADTDAYRGYGKVVASGVETYNNAKRAIGDTIGGTYSAVKSKLGPSSNKTSKTGLSHQKSTDSLASRINDKKELNLQAEQVKLTKEIADKYDIKLKNVKFGFASSNIEIPSEVVNSKYGAFGPEFSEFKMKAFNAAKEAGFFGKSASKRRNFRSSLDLWTKKAVMKKTTIPKVTSEGGITTIQREAVTKGVTSAEPKGKSEVTSSKGTRFDAVKKNSEVGKFAGRAADRFGDLESVAGTGSTNDQLAKEGIDAGTSVVNRVSSWFDEKFKGLFEDGTKPGQTTLNKPGDIAVSGEAGAELLRKEKDGGVSVTPVGQLGDGTKALINKKAKGPLIETTPYNPISKTIDNEKGKSKAELDKETEKAKDKWHDLAYNKDILAKTIYGEMRGGNQEQQENVANAIINRVNRVKNAGGDATPSSVALANMQFSAWNPGDPNRKLMEGLKAGDPTYDKMHGIASNAIGGKLEDKTQGAGFYYANYMDQKGGPPDWAKTEDDKKKMTLDDKKHKFFKGIKASKKQLGDLTLGSKTMRQVGGPESGTSVPTEIGAKDSKAKEGGLLATALKNALSAIKELFGGDATGSNDDSPGSNDDSPDGKGGGGDVSSSELPKRELNDSLSKFTNDVLWNEYNAHAGKVTYNMGSKNPTRGAVDCSGEVSWATRKAEKGANVEAEKEGKEPIFSKKAIKNMATGAAWQVSQNSNAGGGLIKGADAIRSQLKPGMIIGMGVGSHVKGRPMNIGHIVQAFNSPSGEMYIGESRGGRNKVTGDPRGVMMMKKDSWFDDYGIKRSQGKLYATDPFRTNETNLESFEAKPKEETMSGLVNPVSSTMVTSKFGDRGIEAEKGGHLGIDLRTGPGGNILAAGPGKIAKLGSDSGTIFQEVEEGKYFSYMHTNPSVKVGQEVKAGDVIGTASKAGLPEGIKEHLHFGVHDGEKQIDPLPFLKAGGVPLNYTEEVPDERAGFNFNKVMGKMRGAQPQMNKAFGKMDKQFGPTMSKMGINNDQFQGAIGQAQGQMNSAFGALEEASESGKMQKEINRLTSHVNKKLGEIKNQMQKAPSPQDRISTNDIKDNESQTISNAGQSQQAAPQTTIIQAPPTQQPIAVPNGSEAKNDKTDGAVHDQGDFENLFGALFAAQKKALYASAEKVAGYSGTPFSS